jgi:hypothetical protein
MLRRFGSRAVCAVVMVAGAAACGKRDGSTAAETATVTVTPPPTGPTGAPPSTSATDPMRVSDIRVGSTIGADKRVTEETDTFKPTETIYASVTTTGTAPSSMLAARWTYGTHGQLVKADSQSITPSGTATTEFHISKPGGWPKGSYSVAITVDGTPAGSKAFTVK